MVEHWLDPAWLKGRRLGILGDAEVSVQATTDDVFDSRLALPFVLLVDDVGEPATLLAQGLKRLARAPFRPEAGEKALALGDVLVDLKQGVTWEELRAVAPWASDESDVLDQLAREASFRSAEWRANPSDAQDGFYVMQAPTKISVNAVEPWGSTRCDREVYQVATALFLRQGGARALDPERVIASLKSVEKNLASYKRLRGLQHPYTDVHLASEPPRFVLGPDLERPLFLAWSMACEVKMPASVLDLGFVLHLREGFDEEGYMITETYSSDDQFCTNAGRDTYIPVYDAEQGLRCLLMVTTHCLDLKGYGRGKDNQRTRVTTILEYQGSLKYYAEEAYGER